MSILMNILWLLLGGIFTAVEYVVASVGMMITIIGIPFGIQTLKNMRKAGVTALAFQANRLIMLDREKVIAFANRHSIAITGIDSGLTGAPVRP